MDLASVNAVGEKLPILVIEKADKHDVSKVSKAYRVSIGPKTNHRLTLISLLIMLKA